MIHRVIRGIGAAFLGVLLSSSIALAGNPAGSAQPGAECGDEDATAMPAGFATDGFEIAEEHYAGEGDASLNNAGSDHAVSQYDVACYQLTLHAH
jgi:hypothetical protein